MSKGVLTSGQRRLMEQIVIRPAGKPTIANIRIYVHIAQFKTFLNFPLDHNFEFLWRQCTAYFNAKDVFRMNQGRNCDIDKLSELDSSEKVAEAFLQSDYRCKSFTEEGISVGPHSTGNPSHDCTHLSEGSDPDCTQSVEGKSRICPCSYDDV